MKTTRYHSKGETQIARLLDRYGIPYRYEHPLAVIDSGRTKIWYPDFSLPGYGMIIEYFGLNGDPSYRAQAKHKVQVYKAMGIEGLFLNEDSFKGEWPARIMGQIEDILARRLSHFRGKMCLDRQPQEDHHSTR